MPISAVKIQEYRDTVIHIAQQGDNRVRPYVTEVASSGEFYNWDRLDPTDAIERTKATKRQNTPYINEIWTRRTSTPRVFEHTLTFEDYDKAEMAIDPQCPCGVRMMTFVFRRLLVMRLKTELAFQSPLPRSWVMVQARSVSI